LHDFAWEILWDQPADIIDYSYHYFKCIDDGVPFDYAFKGSGKGKCPPGVNVMGLWNPEDPIPPEALPKDYKIRGKSN